MQSGIMNSKKLQIPKQFTAGIYLISLTDDKGKMEYGRLVVH